MEKETILLVDDDLDTLQVGEALFENDYDIKTATSVAQAKAILLNNDVDVTVMDLNFEGQEQDGVDLIDYALRERPKTSLVILSGDHNTERVMRAMRRDVVDCVAKGRDYENVLRLAIQQGLQRRTLLKEQNQRFQFMSKSPLIQQLLTKLDKILRSPSDSPILITGESGTGKEYLAQYISSRLNKKLVASNMAAIPKGTAESELFGHVKGSFTGAVSNKIGLIEQAHGRAFFLDEIGDCSLEIQAKLLRVIQEREILPVGANEPRKINVRFIAATHRDLHKMVQREEFRNDLLQRLNTFAFRIPALRERPEDVVHYTHTFVEELAGNSPFRIEPSGIDALMAYSWPGNVRELHNIIERAVIMSDRRVLDAETVNQAIGDAGEIENLSRPQLAHKIPERTRVLEVLKEANGNRTKAAQLMQVHPTTFFRWVRKYGLKDVIAPLTGRRREDQVEISDGVEL